MVKKIALAIVMCGVATVASAGSCDRHPSSIFDFFYKPEHCVKPTPMKAPEIDPASAMGGLTLLLGGLVVLRGRRSKTPAV